MKIKISDLTSKISGIVDKIKSDKQKLILVIIFSFIILYADFTLLFKAQSQRSKVLTSKIKAIKVNLDKLSKDVAAFESLKNKQLQTKGKIISEAKKIISEEELPSFMQVIYSIANKNKVNMLQISPNKEAKIKTKIISVEAQQLIPYSILLDLSCAYHNLGAFINELEKAQSFIEVLEMRISRSPSDYLRENVRLLLGTYVKK